MIYLPNNCRCSELKVSPAKWNTKGATTKVKWRIYYRFYEAGQKPHYEEIKAGINFIHDLSERRQSVKDLIEQELYKLKHEGFNPRTKNYERPLDSGVDIDEDTPFIQALYKANKLLKVVPQMKANMESMIRSVEKASLVLHLNYLPISQIRRKHIKQILLQCSLSPKWSACRHNMYRSYFIMLFKELGEYEAVGANPASDISKWKEVKKLKKVLNDEERKKINEHLYKNNYRFWLFMNIFFHSGGRETELMKLKGSDVDLSRQVYRTIILKGKEYREVERTIKDVALPYWIEAMEGCSQDDHVFSRGLLPGTVPISRVQITRRWNRWVKKPSGKKGSNGLGIEVDFYSLKHLNTTETVDELQKDFALKVSQKLAAVQNGHTSEAMVVNIYDVKGKDRQHEQLKKVGNKFA